MRMAAIVGNVRRVTIAIMAVPIMTVMVAAGHVVAMVEVPEGVEAITKDAGRAVDRQQQGCEPSATAIAVEKIHFWGGQKREKFELL